MQIIKIKQNAGTSGIKEQCLLIKGYCTTMLENIRSLHDPYFKDLNVLVEIIYGGTWPNKQIAIKIERQLLCLQKAIYTASQTKKTDAMRLIEKYSFNVAVRFCAINNIRHNSKIKKIQSDTDCLNVLNLSQWSNRAKWNFLLNPVLDEVLQLSFHSIIDPYYDAEYPDNMFGGRKGRNAIQAVALLKTITNFVQDHNLGILILEIPKNTINHNYVLKHFDYPIILKFLIQRWLKPCVRNDKKYDQVTRGSIMLNLILNVVVMRILEGRDEKSNVFQPKIFNQVNNYKIGDPKSKPKSIKRHLIYYNATVVITTDYPDELEFMFKQVKLAFMPANIKPYIPETAKTYQKKNKSNCRHQMVDLRHHSFKNIGFDFLEFRFAYIVTTKLRKGGIIKQKCNLTKQKVQNSAGSFLVYNSIKVFDVIKKQCAIRILELSKASVYEVIYELNIVLRHFVQCFAWSNSLNRLQTLEGLVHNALKRGIFKKFRDSSKTKTAHHFFICGQRKNQPDSPYLHICHIHARVPRSHRYLKTFNSKAHHLYFAVDKMSYDQFLVLPSQDYNIIPIENAVLNKCLSSESYYVNPEKLIENQFKIMKTRRIFKTFENNLLIRQKALCAFCKMPMMENPLISAFEDSWTQKNLKLHLIDNVKKKGRKLDTMKNSQLMHSSCYDFVMQEESKEESKKETPKVKPIKCLLYAN
jgi:hypothetical protein